MIHWFTIAPSSFGVVVLLVRLRLMKVVHDRKQLEAKETKRLELEPMEWAKQLAEQINGKGEDQLRRYLKGSMTVDELELELDYELGRAQRPCGAKTSKGTPCMRDAGWGTQHAGTGLCKQHEPKVTVGGEVRWGDDIIAVGSGAVVGRLPVAGSAHVASGGRPFHSPIDPSTGRPFYPYDDLRNVDYGHTPATDRGQAKPALRFKEGDEKYIRRDSAGRPYMWDGTEWRLGIAEPPGMRTQSERR